MSSLSVEARLHLITRHLDEVIGGTEKLRTLLEQRDLRVYWGTATTGAPHIAYFVPMTKIADFLRAGCEVTILFADLHAFLDNMKSTWERLQYRTRYYECIIRAMLRAVDVPLDKLRFVRGTDYQLTREYTLDMYKLTTLTTERNAKKAGAEVVKQVESPLLSGMLYPLLQVLDEQYLNVDAQFGGVDQRKIFTFAERALPALKYSKRIHLMNPMVPGLTGSKMSSSESGSKIDLLDPPDVLTAKIKGAFCEVGKVENNGVLAFVKMVLFQLPSFAKGFTIERKPEHGGNVHFNTYSELEQAFVNKEIYPLDLKNNVTSALQALLASIRQEFESPEMKELIQRAYAPLSESENAPSYNKIDMDEDEKETTSFSSASSAVLVSNGKPAACTTAVVSTEATDALIAKLDIRVGKVLSVEKVPNSDKLYVEQVDLGESEPRQIVSGLQQYLSVDDLKGAMVCCLVNLKPAKLAGVKSMAMILCAVSADGMTTELLQPPVGATIGERVFFPPVHDGAAKMEARANEKTLTEVWPRFKTNDERIACYNSLQAMTTQGPITVKSMRQSLIK